MIGRHLFPKIESSEPDSFTVDTFPGKSGYLFKFYKKADPVYEKEVSAYWIFKLCGRGLKDPGSVARKLWGEREDET